MDSTWLVALNAGLTVAVHRAHTPDKVGSIPAPASMILRTLIFAAIVVSAGCAFKGIDAPKKQESEQKTTITAGDRAVIFNLSSQSLQQGTGWCCFSLSVLGWLLSGRRARHATAAADRMMAVAKLHPEVRKQVRDRNIGNDPAEMFIRERLKKQESIRRRAARAEQRTLRSRLRRAKTGL